MATGGSIQIDVLANTSKLISGMKKAEGVVAKSAKVMTLAVKAFAAVFVGGALINSIKQTAREVDKLGKTASKLGIQVDKLQGLQFAAEQSGVAVETLNMALQRSTRRISEAARGYGEAKGALAELGLSASELNRLSPDEQLKKIADAMEGVTTQSDKVRLSMKLFDSEGVALVNMLKGGSAALNDYQTEMDSLGTLTDDQVKSIEKMNDATNKMSKAWSHLGDEFTAALAPTLTAMADWAKRMAVHFKSLVAVVVTSGSVIKNAMLELFGGDSDKTFEAIRKMQKAWFNLTNSVNTNLIKPDIVGSLGITPEDLATKIGMWEELKKAMVEYANSAKSNAAIATEAINSIGSTMVSNITSGFRSMMDGANTWKDSFKNIIKDVIAKLIELLVVQKSVDSLMDAFGGGISTSSIGVAGMAASGGVTKSGGSYLVGEKGPEIVTLPGNTNVTPNSDIGNNQGVTVNVINNTSSQVEVKDNGAGQIDIIIAKIANDIRLGAGTLGSSLESRYGLQKV